MSKSQSRQENIQAGGDVASGDIIKNIINLPDDPSGLRALIQQADEELKTNTECREIFHALQRYVDNVDDDPVVGLESKLNDAKRDNEISKAIILKEEFSKLLQRHILSASAQHVYAYLLAQLEMLFDHKIRPLIVASKMSAEIDSAIADEVFAPVAQRLPAGNALGIYHRDLRGMLYFLTGNCHIRWAP